MVKFPSEEALPAPGYGESAVSDLPADIEAFMNAKIKIAIQRDGELTDISRTIFSDEFDIDIPARESDSRSLVSARPGGEFGFLYARNKDICALVAAGAVDMAIVGMDRVIEDEAEESLEVVAQFSDRALWPIVFATAVSSGIRSFEQVARIATKYPVIAGRYLEAQARVQPEIIGIAGGAEIYPHLGYNGGGVDGIIDMSVTGASLKTHGLVAWDPPVCEVYPVLIRAKQEKPEKRQSYE